MREEMEDLRRANPVTADEARRLISLDKRAFVDGLENDSWYLGDRSTEDPDSGRRWGRGKVMAVALAAAAVVVAFVAFAATDPFEDRAVIEAQVASPGPGQDDAVLVDLVGRSFDRASDLLVVHFDYADRSDGHGSVAAREVTSWFDLDPLVVAGTQSPQSDRPVHEYVSVMRAAWDAEWLDAGASWSEALGDSIERWLVTLDTGGHVWVAEGGVSDFTADVVRGVLQRRPDLDTHASVHVVQHDPRNEAATLPDGLMLVEAQTAYRRIDPGNAFNTTADFSGATEGFEAAVLTGIHRQRWPVAFDYEPVTALDFADAVLLLDVLGVGIEQVADADDFTAFFIGDQPDAALRGDS